MSGRLPRDFPTAIAKGEFNQKSGYALYLWAMSLFEAVGGMQSTPLDPSRIEAGATADPSPTDSQAVAADDHVHSVDTATPSVPVALTGLAAEGTGAALMRADARLRLHDGIAAGNVLTDLGPGNGWASMPAPTSAGGGGGVGEDGADGDLGPPGPPGPSGAAGAAGAAGQSGPPGFPSDDECECLPIPGPLGATGATGATGPAGLLVMGGVDGEAGEDGLSVVGPAGASGATGAAGPVGPAFWPEDGVDGEMGPPGPAGTSGSSGTVGDLAVSAYQPSADESIADYYCCIISGYYEIISGFTLTLGTGAIMDIV